MAGEDFAPAPNSQVEMIYQAGMDALARSAIEAAIVAFEAAVSMAPDWPAAYYQLGRAYVAAERYEDADASFRSARELAPQNLEVLLDYAANLYRLGREEAAAAFQDALSKAPDNPLVYRRLAEAAAAAGRVGDQLFGLARSLQLEPGRPEAEAERENLWALFQQAIAQAVTPPPEDPEEWEKWRQQGEELLKVVPELEVVFPDQNVVSQAEQLHWALAQAYAARAEAVSIPEERPSPAEALACYEALEIARRAQEHVRQTLHFNPGHAEALSLQADLETALELREAQLSSWGVDEQTVEVVRRLASGEQKRDQAADARDDELFLAAAADYQAALNHLQTLRQERQDEALDSPLAAWEGRLHDCLARAYIGAALMRYGHELQGERGWGSEEARREARQWLERAWEEVEIAEQFEPGVPHRPEMRRVLQEALAASAEEGSVPSTLVIPESTPAPPSAPSPLEATIADLEAQPSPPTPEAPPPEEQPPAGPALAETIAEVTAPSEETAPPETAPPTPSPLEATIADEETLRAPEKPPPEAPPPTAPTVVDERELKEAVEAVFPGALELAEETETEPSLQVEKPTAPPPTAPPPAEEPRGETPAEPVAVEKPSPRFVHAGTVGGVTAERAAEEETVRCTVCGAPNPVSARVCWRCKVLVHPPLEELTPVERLTAVPWQWEFNENVWVLMIWIWIFGAGLIVYRQFPSLSWQRIMGWLGVALQSAPMWIRWYVVNRDFPYRLWTVVQGLIAVLLIVLWVRYAMFVAAGYVLEEAFGGAWLSVFLKFLMLALYIGNFLTRPIVMEER